MAPKKTKTWKDNYQDLMDDYGILFEGPKQPPDWPKEHKHLFEVIRDIWAIRYANYRTSNKLTTQAVRERRRTAAEISEKAHRLGYGRINEDTWRGLEAEVMRMFERKAVCEFCKNELYMIEHEAEPLADNEFAKLKRKRKRRRACTCDLESGSVIAELEDSDEAQPVIFTVYKSTAMMHNPIDKLEQTDIPMEPDRTVGLSVSPRMRRALRVSLSELSHCPMRGTTDVLYPFLLIEAKRGVDTPGFAAIEAQTAFPLRRLLMLQDNLQREAGTSFDPLVWFFAYQGEEWRLYAGTLREANVHVYDLWHGTVESLDCSLQLLQIVDYLWTWARDIYRPQIRHCLCSLVPTIREISPSTDGSLSRSQSVLSELRLRPLTAPQVDVVMEDDQHTDDFAPQTVLSATQNNGLRLLQYGPNWPSKEQCGFPQTGLRHSDLIIFSFRAFHCPTRDQVLQYPQIESGYKIAAERFDSLLRSGSIVILKYGQMGDLERSWTGREATTMSTPVPAAILEERKGVYFNFHTFFRRKDWQIVRELNCVLWDLADVQRHNAAVRREAFSATYSKAEKFDHYATLVAQLSMVQDISGKASVSYALNNTRLILSNVPTSEDDSSLMRWVEGRSPHMEQFENPASRSYWPPHFYHESAQTVALEQKTSEREAVEVILPAPKEMGQMGGILAKKPQSWPAQCPRFCLFVLLEIEVSERNRLGQLLSNVIQQREFYGAIDERSGQEELFIDAEDRRLIRKWLGSFES